MKRPCSSVRVPCHPVLWAWGEKTLSSRASFAGLLRALSWDDGDDTVGSAQFLNSHQGSLGRIQCFPGTLGNFTPASGLVPYNLNPTSRLDGFWLWTMFAITGRIFGVISPSLRTIRVRAIPLKNEMPLQGTVRLSFSFRKLRFLYDTQAKNASIIINRQGNIATRGEKLRFICDTETKNTKSLLDAQKVELGLSK